MPHTIRFEIHTEAFVPDQLRTDLLSIEEIARTSRLGASDALFAILATRRLMNGRMGGTESLLERILQQSMEEQPNLEKNEERVVDISHQRYDTTDRAFTECAVCCEAYKTADTMVSVLDCGHIFHPKCITEWGHYNPVCPVCKAVVKII